MLFLRDSLKLTDSRNMAATSPNPDEPFDDSIPPPVYEVEEELIERRIRSVPIPNDRRGGRDPNSGPEDRKDENKQ